MGLSGDQDEPWCCQGSPITKFQARSLWEFFLFVGAVCAIAACGLAAHNHHVLDNMQDHIARIINQNEAAQLCCIQNSEKLDVVQYWQYCEATDEGGDTDLQATRQTCIDANNTFV